MRKYLSDIRLNKGYSQRRLAREAGISFQHYSKIESGERGNKVSFLIIGRIADVLDIPLDDFYKMELEYQEKLELERERKRYHQKIRFIWGNA